MNLNDTTIAKLTPPPGKAQLKINDQRQTGLYLFVGARTKTWMLKRRNRWHRVGGWPALGVAAARQRVLELLAADDLNRPMGLTVQAAHALWKKRRVRSPLTVANHQTYLALHFADWHDTDLHKITRLDVQRRHEKITRERGPGAANNGLKAFRSWWNEAMRVDPALPAAPTISVNWNRQERVDESALLQRLTEWNTRLDAAFANPLRAIMSRFTLLTGLRASEVLAIHKDHIQGGVLLVPQPKGGRPYSIPLEQAHMDLLDAAAPYMRRGRVFPIARAQLPRGTVKAYADLPWSPHSLRRVFISACVEVGLTPFEIALLVNHQLPGVTFGYVAKSVDLRPQMARVCAYLTSRLHSPTALG